MKPSTSDSERRWAQLVAQARNDSPPPLDPLPLLVRLEAELTTLPTGWLPELRALLESRRWLAACAAGTTAAAVLLSWQIVTWLDALVWLEWVNPGAGGPL